MKVLMLNGSCHKEGCTYTALNEIKKVLESEGIETEIFQIGSAPLRDCTGCMGCRKLDNNRCVFNDDDVNLFIEKAESSDGFIFGSPVYYAHPDGRLLSFIDRAFFAGKKAFEYKPAAAIVSARRSGTTASLDVIGKHFTINNMPVVSSNYWNMVHGNTSDEVIQDREGIQIMQVLGRNMAWILKCIESGKQNGIVHPENIEKIHTNFIR